MRSLVIKGTGKGLIKNQCIALFCNFLYRTQLIYSIMIKPSDSIYISAYYDSILDYVFVKQNQKCGSTSLSLTFRVGQAEGPVLSPHCISRRNNLMSHFLVLLLLGIGNGKKPYHSHSIHPLLVLTLNTIIITCSVTAHSHAISLGSVWPWWVVVQSLCSI